MTGRLKIAALLETAKSDEASYSPRSYCSMSGRAIASPVMKISWTFSRSMVDQISAGSNVGARIVVCPPKRCMSIPHCAPPCMIGLSGKVIIGAPSVAFFDWLYSSRRSPL